MNTCASMKANTAITDVKSKEKSKENGAGRHWVPPPALTSHIGKQEKNRKVANPVKGHDDKHADFEEKLQGLLQEIRQLKSYVSSDQNEKDLLEQKEKVRISILAIDELEKTIHKAVEELKLLQKDENAYKSSLDVVKGELQKNLTENEHLNLQQRGLLEKLNLVEKNATEAVDHIITLRKVINKLANNGSNWSISAESSQKYAKDILAKIHDLDNANQSLQKIISHTPIAEISKDQQQEIPNNVNWSNLQQVMPKLSKNDIVKLTQKTKELQDNVEDDRRQIYELRNTVQKIKQTSVKDKERLMKSINMHKERVNKYLSTVDNLKLNLSKKENEISDAKREIGSLNLQLTCLMSERDRLEIEKTTLIGKCRSIESLNMHRDLALTNQSQELSSNLVQFSTKINILEGENEKLKVQLTNSKREIEQCKADLHQQNQEIEKLRKNAMDNIPVASAGFSRTGTMQNTQANNNADSGQGNWMQMTELWKELQSDKLNILQVLKELEQKLEKSQEVNNEFRRELHQKEDGMREINLRLQEKIEENKSLKGVLESAIADAKRMNEQVITSSLSQDRATQAKLSDFEKQVQEYKKENSLLRKEKLEVERNLSLQIKELQERLDLMEKSKNALHEYIAFLKSSYANVFGDASLATKAYPF